MWNERLNFWALLVAVLLLGASLGFRAGRTWPQEEARPVEAPAPARRLSERAVTLERNPKAQAPSIPTGLQGELVRVAVAQIQPTTLDPIEVRVYHLELADGSQRATVETSQGQVLGGWDLPFKTQISRPRRWGLGAGVTVDAQGQRRPLLVGSWSYRRVEALGTFEPERLGLAVIFKF